MSLTITNKLIIEEAQKHGVSHTVVSEKHDIIVLEYNGKKKMIRRARVSDTNGVFSYIADNKDATYSLMDHFGYPYPFSLPCETEDEMQTAIEKLGYPLVIKPSAGAHGNGVTTNIQNIEDCRKAISFAQSFNTGEVIAQSHFFGEDYRIMVVGYKVIAVTKRIPARVFSDGVSTVEDLIQKENQNPLRGVGHSKPLTKITIDDDLITVLANEKMDLKSIPKKGDEVRLRRIGNLSQGGEAEDVTELVPQENIKVFENIAKDLQAQVVGIDILSKDPTQVLTEKDFVVIEVNVSPGIRMHHFPSKGNAHNVAYAILETMFPEIKK